MVNANLHIYSLKIENYVRGLVIDPSIWGFMFATEDQL